MGIHDLGGQPADRTNRRLAELLRSHRRRAGLTQRALAHLSTVSVRTIRDVEAGRTRPREQTARLLAKAIGLDGVAHDAFLAASREISHEEVTDLPAMPPEPVDSFLAREEEIRTVMTVFGAGHSRMVSISGLGGSGKTRLAIETTRRLHNVRQWPVLWVHASARRGETETPETLLVRQALTPGETRSPSFARLCRLLGQQEILLVLDGLHDAVSVGPPVVHLLQRCSGLRVLATALTPWREEGAYALVLDSLPTPAGDDEADLAMLEAVPSVRLIVNRLAQARFGFALTDTNASTVAALCRRVDGLPLALEIAAHHAAVLSLRELATAPSRELLELAVPVSAFRHPLTLGDLVGNSYSLLAANHRAYLHELAKLGPTWTMAEAAGSLRRSRGESVGALAALVAAGMVRVRHDDHTPGFELPNLVQDFLVSNG